MKATLSPKAMEALSHLANSMSEGKSRKIPVFNSMGDAITSVKELASAMGVDLKVAAAYALETDSEELKANAVEVLAPGIYNAFEDAYEAVVHYAYDVATKQFVDETKRVRMVRSASGVRRFGQKLGSIIVSDGGQALDAITAAHNDVPGYDKVVDKRGNSFYIGVEKGQWVVRSGSSKAVVFQTNSKQGHQEALYWLNSRLGGSRGKPTKKSVDEDVEEKTQRTPLSVERLGKQNHAFRNKNGDYSYPISNVADLKNAIQAFGRAAEADRAGLKRYIKGQARRLKRTDLIPDGWKSDEMGVEEKDWNLEPGVNWVEASKIGLPDYIERIAKAIFRGGGKTRSQCIAIAISRCKVWATGKGVNADTQAKAAKAVAEWEALKAANKARMLAKRSKKG